MRSIFDARLLARVATALFLAAVFWPQGAAAQHGTVRSVYNEWKLRCETAPGAPAEQCALVQSVTAEDRPNVGLTVIILKTADGKSRIMRVLVPLGVLIPKGLGLRIDQTDIGSAAFVRCLPNGCVSEVYLDEKLIAQLRGGKTALFLIYQTPEEGIGVPLSLAGFSAGYDRLDKAP